MPGLPDGRFSDWQMAAMPEHLKTIIVAMSNMLARNEPPRAFIVDCQYGGDSKKEMRGLTIRTDGQPIFTITAGQNRRPIRAQLSTGRIVSMTPLALAQFQSFPDWYRLPENKILACKGIGNACPSLWYQKLAKNLFPMWLSQLLVLIESFWLCCVKRTQRKGIG